MQVGCSWDVLPGDSSSSTVVQCMQQGKAFCSRSAGMQLRQEQVREQEEQGCSCHLLVHAAMATQVEYLYQIS